MRRPQWFWVAIAVSLIASLTPWALPLLYPFKLFTTWVHECSHALMAVLVGGHVTAVTIEPDTSGRTHSLVPASRAAGALVVSAGYLGASLVGCFLMAATRVERRARAILYTVGACMLLTVVVWMRNVFGAVVVLAWGMVLVTMARRRRMANALRFLLSLLAVQVALNAVYDIRVLFLVDGPSDAATMARLFLLPAWFWAAAWMAMSVAMLGWTLWKTRG
jgi:peptidase M50B-like protein